MPIACNQYSPSHNPIAPSLLGSSLLGSIGFTGSGEHSVKKAYISRVPNARPLIYACNLSSSHSLVQKVSFDMTLLQM